MDAMLPDGWADVGVAAAGATAGPTGLVVGAIPVDLTQIRLVLGVEILR